MIHDIYLLWRQSMMMMCKNAQNVMNVINGNLADAYRGGRSELVERFPPNQPDRRGGIFIILINEYGS